MSDIKNLIIAVIASVVIMMGWQYFYELPRMKAQEERVLKQRALEAANKKTQVSKAINSDVSTAMLDRKDIIAGSANSRVYIDTPQMKGSISLLGARFDDITLPQYRHDINHTDPVILLSPSRDKSAYFTEFGWVSNDSSIELPNAKTIWTADKKTLTANGSVVLTWRNSQNVLFKIIVSLDDKFMFDIKQTVENNSKKIISFQNYGLINRIHNAKEAFAISHEGPVGTFNKILKEVPYKDLESDKGSSFLNNSIGSWFGISDKYWLTAIIPAKSNGNDKYFDTRFKLSGTDAAQGSRFQVDYVGQKEILAPGEKADNSVHFFAGAKVLSFLEEYQQKYNIDLFDRAIDFGWFYFLTKPMFNALKYFYDLVGNFGLSILIVTIIVKLLLLPMASKSYTSMNKMKVLQPEMARIRELHASDKMKQNQAIMELYKKEKVNPLSGCLPLLIQIPIFFSLYKVLFINIEMRHAPFYGWIHDLSVPDPTTLFNLFGLIPWNPPAFLMIGVWPLLMALSMYIQQQLSPAPTDPIQAKVMKYLPLIFVFMFASFPAGLVIYWAWSNVLSIAQQLFIKYYHK